MTLGPRALGAARMMLACLILGGCGLVGPSNDDRSDLERAMGRWAASGNESYTYTLRRLCYCLPETIGPYEVRVVAGTPAAVVRPEDGEPIDPEYAHLFPGVDGLFEIIDDALREGADRLDVEYDSATGTPIRIDIDYIEAAADDEILYESTIPEPFQPPA